jgi:RNA recognition motif-containing protein
LIFNSDSATIPTNPRTGRPVGYAFVDLKSASDAQKAIDELSGKEILDRKVSVQFTKHDGSSTKPAAAAPAGEEGGSGGEGTRRRGSGRGRGRGRGERSERGDRAERGGRGGRGGRAPRAVSRV